MTKSLYNLKSIGTSGNFQITKFIDELDVESTYIVSDHGCECPQFQGRGKTCRHMKMLPFFLELQREDTEYFLDFDTKTWHQPLAPEYEMEFHAIALDHKRKAEQYGQQSLEVIPNNVTGVVQDVVAAEGLPPPPQERVSRVAPEPSAVLPPTLKRRRV